MSMHMIEQDIDKDGVVWIEFDHAIDGSGRVFIFRCWKPTSSAERRSFRMFKGKHFTVMARSKDSYEELKRMVYDFGAALMAGRIEKCSLQD